MLISGDSSPTTLLLRDDDLGLNKTGKALSSTRSDLNINYEGKRPC